MWGASVLHFLICLATMNNSDVPYALECAALISKLEWDGSVPPVKFVDRDYLGNAGTDIDRNGNRVAASPSMTGAYFFGAGDRTGTAYFSNMADKPVMAHEMTHYLQDRNGMNAGAASAAAGVLLSQRRDIESQGYETEKNAPYECFTLLGRWKQDIRESAQRRVEQYELKSEKPKD